MCQIIANILDSYQSFLNNSNITCMKYWLLIVNNNIEGWKQYIDMMSQMIPTSCTKKITPELALKTINKYLNARTILTFCQIELKRLTT